MVATSSYPRDLSHWLFGYAAGPNGLIYEGSAHSLVIDLLSDVGLVGLLCVAVLLANALGTEYLGFRLVLLAFLGYSVTYPWISWMWFFVGLAFATRTGDR